MESQFLNYIKDKTFGLMLCDLFIDETKSYSPLNHFKSQPLEFRSAIACPVIIGAGSLCVGAGAE
jgi:hypothetical protein